MKEIFTLPALTAARNVQLALADTWPGVAKSHTSMTRTPDTASIKNPDQNEKAVKVSEILPLPTTQHS